MRLDAAYVSPLCRAQQTAHILLRGTNVPLYTQPALAERDFGAYEGLRKEDFDFEAFWHPEVPCPAPGAEPAGAFYARVQGFLRALGRGPGAVLLVAHGGVSIPVQLFARGVQSLGPGGAYVPLIWPHGQGAALHCAAGSGAKSIKFTEFSMPNNCVKQESLPCNMPGRML